MPNLTKRLNDSFVPAIKEGAISINDGVWQLKAALEQKFPKRFIDWGSVVSSAPTGSTHLIFSFVDDTNGDEYFGEFASYKKQKYIVDNGWKKIVHGDFKFNAPEEFIKQLK